MQPGIPGISVEPPTELDVIGLQSPWDISPIQESSTFMQGYPTASNPQEIPRIDTKFQQNNDFGPQTGSPSMMWEARSPASSESGFSNPSSPNAQFAEFHDDGSEYSGDNHALPLNSNLNADIFNFDEYLNLSSVQEQPPLSPRWQQQRYPDGFISGPDPSNLPPSPGSFLHQSIRHGSPYSTGGMLNQRQDSPTFEAMNGSSSPFADRAEREIVLPQPPQPHQHRSSFSGSRDGFLLPPSPILRKSHSRGSISKGMGHRHTLSDLASIPRPNFNTLSASPTGSYHSPQGSVGSDQFLGVDLHGPGLIRARSAPGPGPHGRLLGRPRTPYDRPEPSHHGMGTAPLDIPPFHGGMVSGSTTPDITGGSSPSSVSESRGIATPAMLAAAEKRRKNPAKYQCPQCSASFTAENSRKRHIASHTGEKRYTCSKPGCGQLFSNDDDRKRHETKSKKHAA